MRNKKGFTLSEVLVTIGIIGLILLIAIPSVMKISASIKQRALEAKKQAIISAAESYAAKNKDVFGDAEQIEIKVGTLVYNGFVDIDSEDSTETCNESIGCVINPVDNSSMNDETILIKRAKSITQAEFGTIGDDLLSVNFDYNGADRGIDKIACRPLISGGTCRIVMQPIKRSGYTIVGWGLKATDEEKDPSLGSELVLSSSNNGQTYYAITYKNVTATFDRNHPQVAIGRAAGDREKTCRIYNRNANCTITTPYLVRNGGGTAIGWNTNKNAETYLVEGEKNTAISSNTTFYAISYIPIKATFDNNNSSVGIGRVTGDTEKECKIYNNNTNCTITTPLLVRNDGGTALGWNTNKNATSASVGIEKSTTISADTIFYAISHRRLTASFNRNGPGDGNYMVSIGANAYYCDTYNSTSSCQITTPSITKSGGKALGWNTDPSATSASVLINTPVTLTNNVMYYAITSRLITAYFNQNGVKNIGNTIAQCYIYNNNTVCSTPAPSITPSDGYYVIGWNSSATATTSQIQPGAYFQISGGETYYAIQGQKTYTCIKNTVTRVCGVDISQCVSRGLSNCQSVSCTSATSCNYTYAFNIAKTSYNAFSILKNGLNNCQLVCTAVTNPDVINNYALGASCNNTNLLLKCLAPARSYPEDVVYGTRSEGYCYGDNRSKVQLYFATDNSPSQYNYSLNTNTFRNCRRHPDNVCTGWYLFEISGQTGFTYLPFRDAYVTNCTITEKNCSNLTTSSGYTYTEILRGQTSQLEGYTCTAD